MENEYTINQAKIYNNKCIQMYEQVEYDEISKDYDELKSLLMLFMKDAEPNRKKTLKIKEREIDRKYKPRIKESKRVLKNTEKRLKYNMDVVIASEINDSLDKTDSAYSSDTND
tara:strand:+ start:199 stop:540 length:342 start_codon:yes stop_codon:yes gene_type:complete